MGFGYDAPSVIVQWFRSIPSVDEEHAYPQVLLAMSTASETHKPVWNRNLPKEFGVILHWGLAHSVLHNEYVLVAPEQLSGVVALNRKTGDVV